MEELTVDFTLNNELDDVIVSEDPVTYTDNLKALKKIAEEFFYEALEKADEWDEVYFADVEYVSGPKDEFTELKKYLDNL